VGEDAPQARRNSRPGGSVPLKVERGIKLLELYYCPEACSLAPHVVLEELGFPYLAHPINILAGENRGEEYLKINPRGKVPALNVEGSILTENVSILTYLADRFTDAKLLPEDPISRAKCVATMSWFSNTVHPANTHINRPERFASDQTAWPSIKDTNRLSLLTYCRELDAILSGNEWIAGKQFTVCDPYALVFYAWGKRHGFAMAELRSFTDFARRLRQRPAVDRVLKRENHSLLNTSFE
jgi:glutathione S-transferase